MAPFATQPPQEAALQQLGVEPVGIRSPMLPRYRDTRGMEFRGLGAAGWFGWYENSKIEQLTQEWLDAKDEDARKKIAAAIQLENYLRCRR